MTQTETWRARHTIAAADGASAADSSSSRRLAVRLWTLLHAQALLEGTIGGIDGASYTEDDHRRLTARREGTYPP
jgi:hypothetical protein